VELHKLQARKRTALISSARFGRRRAFQEDAWRDFLQRKDDVAKEAYSRPVVGSRSIQERGEDWAVKSIPVSARECGSL
jgi:hypothetical protein